MGRTTDLTRNTGVEKLMLLSRSFMTEA